MSYEGQQEMARRLLARVALVQEHIAGDETPLDSGPARYEDAEARLGPRLGEGVIVATDRKLIFRGDRSGQVIVMPYAEIGTVRVRKRWATADLTLGMRDGKVLVFNGGKTFFAAIATLSGARKQ